MVILHPVLQLSHLKTQIPFSRMSAQLVDPSLQAVAAGVAGEPEDPVRETGRRIESKDASSWPQATRQSDSTKSGAKPGVGFWGGGAFWGGVIS